MGLRGPKKGARWTQKRTRRRAAALAKLLKEKELADEAWAAQVLNIGLGDVRDFHDDRGNYIPVSKWTAEMGHRVAGLDIVIKNAEAGDGHTDRVLKLRTHDKLRALELWAKYRGLLTDKHDVTVRRTWEDIIAESRKDDDDKPE